MQSKRQVSWLSSVLFCAFVTVPISTPGMSFASSLHKVCGIRSGTAGNAWLASSGGKPLVTLATQGGDQHLLDEADDRLPQDSRDGPGTQNGKWYCVVFKLDRLGIPIEVSRSYQLKSSRHPNESR